jgi:hypothetical protein
LEERRKYWTPPPYKATRGVLYKVMESVSQWYIFFLHFECLYSIFSFIPVYQECAIFFKGMCNRWIAEKTWFRELFESDRRSNICLPHCYIVGA